MVIMNQMDSHVEGQLIGQHTHTHTDGGTGLRSQAAAELLHFCSSPPSVLLHCHPVTLARLPPSSSLSRRRVSSAGFG